MASTRFTLDFLKAEAGAGFLLAATALIAAIWANSPWGAAYFRLIHAHLALPFGASCDISEAVREGLMAIFFFLVGLEIKYEVVRGQLSDPQKLALPVIAALGGMAMPALVYMVINVSGGDVRGWSIPTATDIAFALAVLAMAGKGLPPSLRVFLLTLAIVDDLGAIVIIGVFYHSAFQGTYLIAVAGLLAVMAGLSRIAKGGTLIAAYLVLFVVLWAASLKAGLAPSSGRRRRQLFALTWETVQVVAMTRPGR